MKQLNPGSEHAKFDFPNSSPWTLPYVEEAYEETRTNKDLWIVREEERLVFETTRPINMGSGNHGVLRDAIQNFSILLPSTNFPPALNKMNAVPALHMGNEVCLFENNNE